MDRDLYRRLRGCGQGSVQTIRGPLACKQGVSDVISVETLFQRLPGLLGLLRRPYNQEVSAVVQEEQKKRGTYHRLSPGMTAIGTYCRVVIIRIISILASQIVRVRKLLNIPRNGGKRINRGVIRKKMRASWKPNRQLCTDIYRPLGSCHSAQQLQASTITFYIHNYICTVSKPQTF